MSETPDPVTTSTPLPPSTEKENSPESHGDTATSNSENEVEFVPTGRGIKFWLIIVSLLVATLLAALDLTAIATALPTISQDLSSNDAASFLWVGASYSITSTAFVTVFGGLSAVFGRRCILITSLTAFLIGSAVCGAAQNTSVLILGRSIQGVGSGGILSLTEIILSDLVPLAERGAFQGAFGAIWSLASAIGPLIGAGFAATNWRGLFYLNIPLSVIVIAICAAFIDLKTPEGSFREKLGRIDWYGNLVFIPAITLFIVGLSSGGNTAPWTDASVLAPLIIGILGLVAWYFVERIVENPTVPFDLLHNRTTLIGFATTFLHGCAALALFYYWPAYFQSALGSGPVDSAIKFFSVAFIVAPFAMVAGGSIGATGKYFAVNIVAWVLMTVGPGLLSIVSINSSKAAYEALPIPFAMGVGLLFSATVFVVLAPLPPSLAGHALSFLVFVRNLGSLVGIVLGSTVLNNELGQRLPTEFLNTVPGGLKGAYAAIPLITSLAEPLQTEVRTAFAQSIRVIWLVLIPFGGIGLIFALCMKEIKLETVTDENWGLVTPEKTTEVKAEEGVTPA